MRRYAVVMHFRVHQAADQRTFGDFVRMLDEAWLAQDELTDPDVDADYSERRVTVRAVSSAATPDRAVGLVRIAVGVILHLLMGQGPVRTEIDPYRVLVERPVHEDRREVALRAEARMSLPVRA
jgi:hypothetical protein